MWRSLFRLRMVLGLVVLVLALLGKVAQSDAYTAADLGTITEHVERGGSKTIPGVDCGARCSDWWTAEHRVTPGTTPGSDAMHKELGQLRRRAAVLSKLSKFGRFTLGPAGFVTVTAGSYVLGRILTQPQAAPASVTMTQFELVPPGHVIPGRAYTSWEDADVGSYTFAQQGRVYLDVNNTAVQFYCTGGQRSPANPPSGAELVVIDTVPPGPTNQGTCGSSSWIKYVIVGPLAAGEVAPAGNPSPGGGEVGSRNITDTDPAAADAAALQAAVQSELATDQYPTLNAWYANQLDSTQPDPTASYATIPNPEPAEVATDYAARLDQLGFTAVTTTVLPPAEANLTLPADAVVAVDPAGGTRVTTETAVRISANPAQADMPLAVPMSLSGETATAYRDRLQGLGLLGRIEVLTDPNLDFGPDAVTSTSPAAGTRVAQGTEVQIRANPTTAPAPSAGASPGGCGLTAPSTAFDGSPLTNANLGSKAPFALVGWLSQSTAGIASGGSERPQANFTALGATVNLGFLANFDPIIGVLRLALTFLLWIGVAWFLYGRTIGRDT